MRCECHWLPSSSIFSDENITEFFTQDYADYAYQLLGKSYCFVKPDSSEIVCAFTVANVFGKPNKQSEVYFYFAMTRKRGMKSNGKIVKE